VVGLILRLPSFNSSLFGDEISTYFIVTGHSLGRVVQLVYSNQETSPPLFFILAWVTKGLGNAAQLIRLPSLVAGIAVIPLTYLLGLRTVGRRAALVGATLVALAPQMIFMSSYGRPFMVMGLLGLVSTFALVRALDEGRACWWFAYAASSCAAAYTHYVVVFLLVAQLIWAFWAQPAARRALLLANVVAALAYLPWLGGFWADLHGPNTTAGEGFGVTTIRNGLEDWSIGTDVSQRVVPGDLAIVLVTVGVATAVIGVALIARRRTTWTPSKGLVLVVVLALAAPVGTILISAAGHNVFNTQDLMASWPGLALSAGVLLTRPSRPVRVVATGLVLAGFAIGALKMTSPDVQTPNVDSAAAFIERVGECGDPVVTESVFAHPLTELEVALANLGKSAQRCHPVIRLDWPSLGEELRALEGPHGQPLSFSAPRPQPRFVAQRAAALARTGDLFLVAPIDVPPKDFVYFPAAAVTQFLSALGTQFHFVRQVNFGGFSGQASESVYIFRR
jgi:hypothetical protein